MSCNYAEGLSPYENKGKLGIAEKFDSPSEVEEKASLLASWIKNAQHIVVHTGAGISTSAGIPDFRGPKGVWTLEKKGLKPDINISWDDAKPTFTHMAIARLVEEDKVKFVITQNIDGLHLRSGVPRSHIAELHGNMFVDECDKCKKMFVRDSPAPTVGQKYTGCDCPAYKENGRKCRGKLKDFVLDWEASLPDDDLTISDTHCMKADLSIVMGSTLQIIPAGNLPTYTQKYQGGRLVICNLQPTKHFKKADLNIHTYVDDVMRLVMDKLDLKVRDYDPLSDPVKKVKRNDLPEQGYIDWTQCSATAKSLKKIGDVIHENFLHFKRLEKKRKNTEDIKTTKLQKREDNDVEIIEIVDENKKEIKQSDLESDKLNGDNRKPKEESNSPQKDITSENIKNSSEVKEEKIKEDKEGSEMKSELDTITPEGEEMKSELDTITPEGEEMKSDLDTITPEGEEMKSKDILESGENNLYSSTVQNVNTDQCNDERPEIQDLRKDAEHETEDNFEEKIDDVNDDDNILS